MNDEAIRKQLNPTKEELLMRVNELTKRKVELLRKNAEMSQDITYLKSENAKLKSSNQLKDAELHNSKESNANQLKKLKKIEQQLKTIIREMQVNL